MALTKKKVIQINKKIRKVKEILPEHLKSKTKRLAYVQSVVNAPLTKEEKAKEAKAITKQCRQDVWNWTNALDKCAFYVAEGRLSLTEIKSKTGVSINKIKKMLALQGEFYSRVQHYRDEWNKKFVAQGYGNRQTRLMVYDELMDKLTDIVHSRQRKYFNRKHPGVDTGLMKRTVKAVGHGIKTKIVRGWDLDADLVREIKDTGILIAKEQGQWSEKVENTNTVLVREYEGSDPNDV